MGKPGKMADPESYKNSLDYLLALFPLQLWESKGVLGWMQEDLDRRYKDHGIDLTMGLFCKWFALLLRMGIFQLRSRRLYWSIGGPFSVDFKFNDIMPEKTWRRIWAVL